MSMFTFYLWKTDRSAESFEIFALDDDAQAVIRARAMLAQHPTCAFVTVWDEDRLTHTESRCDAFDPRPESSAARAWETPPWSATCAPGRRRRTHRPRRDQASAPQLIAAVRQRNRSSGMARAAARGSTATQARPGSTAMT